MGLADQASAGTDSVLLTGVLAFERDYPGSIVRCLEAAWENGRGAREAVSSEMWECLNITHEALPRAVETATGQMPHGFFGWVKERSAILAGLSDSTMSRDESWRFLVLGRSLERVDMTARLLSARYGESWGQMGWVTTLRTCSAYEAYVRTYQGAVDGSSAAEFLILDRLFSRSIYFLSPGGRELPGRARTQRRTGRGGRRARRHLGQARASSSSHRRSTCSRTCRAVWPMSRSAVRMPVRPFRSAISGRRPIVEWSA